VHRNQTPPHEQRLSLTTLTIGSVSSAAAAVVVHHLWRSGTILGAAATPVLVALFAEALRRPVERVTVRSRRRFARGEPIRIYRSRPRWTPIVLTGAAAFAVGAAGLTASEALLQRSIAEPSSRTTLFGGRPHHVPTESEPASRRAAPASTGAREGRGSPQQPREGRPGRAPFNRGDARPPEVTRTPTPARSPEPTPAPASEPVPTPAAPVPTPAAPVPTPAAPVRTPAAPEPTPAQPAP
jgi:hypothetical protein